MPLTTLDERTALVVVDLQNGVRARPTAPHAAQDVIARTSALAGTFRAAGLPVVLVRFTVAEDGSDATPGRADLPRPAGATPPEGWDAVVADLAGHAGDIVVTKRTWGSFHGTDLDLQLRRRGVTQVVLAGVATSLGVESTARAAHEHGYHVTLATDAMTDLDASAHDHSVRRIFPLLGETGTAGEITELLASRGVPDREAVRVAGDVQ
jgi:nicotinamidase-related amidase